MKWHIASVGQFYECNESRVVYFDPASGDTHLISDFAAHLIKLIANEGKPLDNEEIAALVAADIDPLDLSELSQALPNIMKELGALEIVAPT